MAVVYFHSSNLKCLFLIFTRYVQAHHQSSLKPDLVWGFSPSLLLIQLGGPGSAVSSPTGVQGRAPAVSALWGYFEASKRFCWHSFSSFSGDKIGVNRTEFLLKKI